MGAQPTPEDRLAQAKAELRAAELAVQEERKRRRDEERAKARIEQDEHKAKMASECNLVGHPKLDQLYSLAWEYGHSYGYSEVAMYFRDFSRLLK